MKEKLIVLRHKIKHWFFSRTNNCISFITLKKNPYSGADFTAQRFQARCDRRSRRYKITAIPQIKILAGVARRDHDYYIFWVSFPFVNENNKQLFADNLFEVDFFIGICNKEGE